MTDRIPLCVPNVGATEKANLISCIDTNFVSSVGQYVGRLEDLIANKTEAVASVTTGSGTQALRLALHVAGVQPGDLVVMPAFTFIATANAAWQAGATPAFVDIEGDGWTIDPQALEAFLVDDCEVVHGTLRHRQSHARIGAIMPVYTLGNVADMDPLGEIARRFGVKVVADAAAALGSRYRDRGIASLADISALSFNGNKIATTGCGGALFGDDSRALARARHLASTARSGPNYDHDEPAFNYRMSNMDAAVGCAQLDRLDEFVEAKRRIRQAYNQVADGYSVASGFPEPSWCRSNCWFSGIVVDGDLAEDDVREILNSLDNSGLEVRPFWKPLHLQRPYLSAPRAALSLTESLWKRVITLPCSTGLTEPDFNRCVDALDVALRVTSASGGSPPVITRDMVGATPPTRGF